MSSVHGISLASNVSTTGLVGPLVVSGQRLVDQGTGRFVDLKGVNSPSDGFDGASVTTLHAWGANFARIWLSDDLYEQNCKNRVYDTNYVTQIDAEVQALTAAGIYVLLVDGSTDPNCGFSSPQPSGVTPLPGPNALSMFASLAQEFGSNPLVGFEPFNEPEVCPDGAAPGDRLVPLDQLDGDLALAYPDNALLHPSSATYVPTFGSCDGWVGGYPNSSYSNWSQTQANNLAAHALLYGGEVETGSGLKTVSYPGEGFETIAGVLRNNGAADNLIFVDSNLWAADPTTFDYMSSTSQCAGASGSSLSPCWASLRNYVAVEHYYACQTFHTVLGGTKYTCNNTDPESCKRISDDLSHLVTDPATGAPFTVPVVVDEYGWPQPAPAPEVTVYKTDTNTPILTYQHGLFMQNVISFLDQHDVGWAAFDWSNGDQNSGFQSPYVLESGSPVPSSSNAPWGPNADGAPVRESMQGQTPVCAEPPVGFG